MTDLNTTTAVPATATATPQQRIGALVQAIKALEPGDIRAAYRLGVVSELAGRVYLDNFERGLNYVYGQKCMSVGEIIEQIWHRVLNDIAEGEGEQLKTRSSRQNR